MSKYTTELRYICENAAGYDSSKGYKDTDAIIAAAVDKIFSFDFPIFDYNYRSALCQKILRHFYTREIGLESYGLWQLKLQTRLNEIMPFYNQMYRSELYKFNPLYDTDLTTTHDGTKNSKADKTESIKGIGTSVDSEQRNGNNESDNASTLAQSSNISRDNDTTEVDASTHYDLFSDTPQGGLTGVDAETYLTNARKINDTNTKTGKQSSGEAVENTGISNDHTSSTFNEAANKTNTRSDSTDTTGTDTINSTENYVLHVIGKNGGQSFSRMLQEFRETFLNIDMLVINELNDLFMNLW